MVQLTKTKEEIIKKAEELAVEYEARYKGCGQCTFLAVVDALRWGGLEIMSKDVEERLFSGICLLTAGVCMIGEGTCGAVASSVILIGMALGVPKDSDDIEAMEKAGATGRDTIVAKYYQEYNSILCKDVQRKYFGKAWDLSRRDMTMEFLGITDGCTIRLTSMWTTGFILDEFEKGNVKVPA